MNTGREAQLLLLCARVELAPAHRDAIARIVADGGVDWELVLRLAVRHGLAPLAHRHLESVAPRAVPKDVRAALWGRQEATLRRNRAMAVELADIVEFLAEHGIAAIAYKGPTLALAAYGDLGLREFADLDILMQARNICSAKELLLSRGYVAQHPLAPDQERALVRSRRLYELPLVDRARGLMVELHWRADPEVPIVDLDDEGCWKRLSAMRLDGREVRVFAPRELLPILCLHGTKHFWFCLGWLVDAAELVRGHPSLDWEAILADAGRLGCERRIGVGLRLMQEFLDVALPPAARRLADDGEVRALAATIGAGLFEPQERAIGVAEAFMLNLRLRESPARRVRYFLGTLLTPGWGEWLRWPLPRALFFLYYPLRAARLAAKYLPHPFHKV